MAIEYRYINNIDVVGRRLSGSICLLDTITRVPWRQLVAVVL